MQAVDQAIDPATGVKVLGSGLRRIDIRNTRSYSGLNRLRPLFFIGPFAQRLTGADSHQAKALTCHVR